MEIPFNKIYYTGQELRYIQDALEREDLSGNGYYTDLVSTLLEKNFKINRVVMTTSATHALEMAAMMIDLRVGDEVIMPSFTFPSTANAILRQGARPVFAEIDRETLNVDPVDIEGKITDKTRAIIPVHYGGIACLLEKILKIAREYGLIVIEDAAQGVDASYKNKYLGTWGDLGCYSFHSSKNYISGEGGALLINSKNQELLSKAEVISEKGTNRLDFIRGKVEKYSWVDIGSSFLPSDLLMALLYAQLESREEINKKRRIIHDFYFNHLIKYREAGLITGITEIPADCQSNYHLFYLLFNSEEQRDMIIRRMKKKGISTAFHYIPLHLSAMGEKLDYQIGDLPVTERVSKTLLRLPFYTGMSREEAAYVVKVLTNILNEI